MEEGHEGLFAGAADVAEGGFELAALVGQEEEVDGDGHVVEGPGRPGLGWRRGEGEEFFESVGGFGQVPGEVGEVSAGAGGKFLEESAALSRVVVAFEPIERGEQEEGLIVVDVPDDAAGGGTVEGSQGFGAVVAIDDLVGGVEGCGAMRAEIRGFAWVGTGLGVGNRGGAKGAEAAKVTEGG